MPAENDHDANRSSLSAASMPPPADNGRPTIDASHGKLFPPSGTVDVPRMPPTAAQKGNVEQTVALSQERDLDRKAAAEHPHAPDAALAPESTSGGQAVPTEIDTTTANWADSTQPAPDKQTARSHIL